MKTWRTPELEELNVTMTMGGSGRFTSEAHLANQYRQGSITRAELEYRWNEAQFSNTTMPS